MTVLQTPQVADIPVIDLGPLQTPTPDPQALEDIVAQVRKACTDTGFFQIINHGISPSLQTQVFSESKKVFAMSREQKMALKRDPFGNRGYEVLEGQSLDGAVEGHAYKKMQSEYSGNDLKEGYYVGKERTPDDPMLKRRFNGLNMWPPGLTEFPSVMTQYYDSMYDLAVQIMELLALYSFCLFMHLTIDLWD
jgi:isopenicillin N synthase-like dioxygenase